MRTALDTNIISTLWSQEPASERVAAALRQARHEGGLTISGVTYAELMAHPIFQRPAISTFFEASGIQIDLRLQEEVWLEAARRFAVYASRRRAASGSGPRRLLADFLIGAHALLQANRLMTLDDAHFSRYFPELPLYPLVS